MIAIEKVIRINQGLIFIFHSNRD